MIEFRRNTFVFALGASAVLLASCSGGSSVLTRPGPTPSPGSATPTPTATPSAKPTASPTPTAKPTATPTASPTATPTPTAKPTATPTAQPTATPTAAACKAPPPDPNSASITLTGNQQTVNVPCFGDFTSTAVIPANANAGTTVALQTSTDNNLGSAPTASDGTPIEYTSLFPSMSITFNSSTATIDTTVTSPSKIAAPHTYTVEVYVPSFGVAIQTITGLKPTGHSISFKIVPPGGAFPGIQAIVILYQSS